MLTCEKCGAYKRPTMRYWRDEAAGLYGWGAGHACPTCEPKRCIIEETPQWFTDAMTRATCKPAATGKEGNK